MRLHRPKINLPKITPHGIAVFIKALAFFLAAFIIFMLFRINATSNNLAQSAKDIAEQNQRIAKANGQHIDCLADLFAKYTREGRPITIDDLDLCTASSSEAALISGAVDFTRTTPSTRPAPTQNDTQTNTETKPQATSQGEVTPPTETPTPAPVQNPPIEIIGVPVCVPLTNVCVRQ